MGAFCVPGLEMSFGCVTVNSTELTSFSQSHGGRVFKAVDEKAPVPGGLE